MTSRNIILVLAVAAAGCTEDVPTLEVTATALQSVQLAPADDHIPDGLGHYRWELVEAPPDTNLPPPTQQTAAITIDPPTRGTYVYDRWFVGEATEQLSCHVVVDVAGASPTASVAGPSMIAVGAPATLDGTQSTSPEHRTLTYQWRLASRPESSTTDLAGSNDPTATFVPDVAGDYSVELRVFDGELWSEPGAIIVNAR
jgi:hypothetical protein